MAWPEMLNPKTLPVPIIVNGCKVYARPGQTVLETVREQDLDSIPTLCHDPRLEPYGSCFLCVVEIRGAPRLVPACVTKVRDGMEITTHSERIFRARKTALELLLSDHYADCVCPASQACPAGVDVQGYLGFAQLGLYAEALELVREKNPLPVVCGRVCVRKCEVRCVRSRVDEPVGINFVKRFAAENASFRAKKENPPDPSGKSVAVIGGGPAGLTCASFLAAKGHRVRIYESLPKLGGMLRYGIPEYRLPRQELDAEIQQILSGGIEVEVGKSLGRDFTLASLLEREGFAMVFLATGAPRGKRIGVPGENGVQRLRSALDFLRDIELDGAPKLGGRVAVIGGGNSAIDAARSALRCGAEEVVILYRRTRREMPAHPEEIDAAEKEGVKLQFLTAPLEVLSQNGLLTAVRCQRMVLGEPDPSGRRKPVPLPGSEFDYRCDYLYTAIGQDTDLAMLQEEPTALRPDITPWSTLRADPSTMATSAGRIFAGGDVVAGPSAIVDAIAHGRKAAEAIDHCIRTGRPKPPDTVFLSRKEKYGSLSDSALDGIEPEPRSVMPERAAAERIRDFQPVELGLNEKQTRAEASRCLQCGCKSVYSCELKRLASEYGVDLRDFSGSARKHRPDTSHPLIRHDPNKCILCGRCVRTCSELVGLSVFGFVGRGFGTLVKPACGKPLGESACIGCGSCTESCPTGSLERVLPWRGQGPWKTTTTGSVCTFCSVGCEMEIHFAAKEHLWATAVHSRREGSELCRKGRFGTSLIHGPDRLKRPLIKKAGRLVETDWDEAIAFAAGILRKQVEKHGSEAVAVMTAARITLEEMVLVRHLAERGLGTSHVGSIGEHYRGGPRHDLDAILGRTASTCSIQDLSRAETIILAGADPTASYPVAAMAVRQAANRGARVIALHSSRIDLLRSGDLWLDARRGTAGWIYAAILKHFTSEGKQTILCEDKREWEKLESSLSGISLEDAAVTSGVAASKLDACIRELAGGKKTVAVYDIDDTVERASGDLVALAQCLALSGHMGREGEGLLLLRADSNSEGARQTGISRPLHPDRLRSAVLIGENPLASPRARRDFERLEALVVIDHFLTESGRNADAVLPAATLAESEGTVISCDGRLGFVRQASAPPSGLSTGEVLARLAEALGSPVRTADPGQLRAQFAVSLKMRAAQFERLREDGMSLPRNGRLRALEPVRVGTSPWVADVFPYATLDDVVNKKFAALGIAR